MPFVNGDMGVLRVNDNSELLFSDGTSISRIAEELGYSLSGRNEQVSLLSTDFPDDPMAEENDTNMNRKATIGELIEYVDNLLRNDSNLEFISREELTNPTIFNTAFRR